MMALVSVIVAGLVVALVGAMTRFHREDALATLLVLVAFILGGILMGPKPSAYLPEYSVCGRGCPPELRGTIMSTLRP